MKVYIITSGEYSDYSIDRVFLDEKKAEEYVRLNTGKYNSPEIEERETSDENFEIGKYQIKKYITIEYEDKDWFTNKEKFHIQLQQSNTESNPDLNDYPYFNNWYRGSNYNGGIYHNLILHRLVGDDFVKSDIELVKDKYLKICRDYVAKAKSLMIEGYNVKQVEEMLFL